MTKARYKAAPEVLAPTTGATPLPTHLPIAIYYRQSTEAQIGNLSTSMQTVDMVAYLKRCGWEEQKIIMIDMDAGISGSTKIDERPGMSSLFELISEGKVGAVACQDEDRLFRDVTQIQVNIFIEACRASRVLVLTPSMVYDFANEMTTTFHARQFRFKSEMAAEYINSVIKGRLHRAKERLLMEGRWAGSGVPAGYMVDMRKTLPDGSGNDNWRRYTLFEPYAEVVKEYFRLFLLNSGSIRATIRQIHENGPYYPDLKGCPPPNGFRAHYKFKRYGNGFCPGRTGLVGILTNAAYIGHWTVNNVVVRYHNHPALVDEEVFIRAFNYLSQTTLKGKVNANYLPIQEHSRPRREQDREVERPLCTGLIVSPLEQEWRNVGTNWVSTGKHYAYVLWSGPPHDNYVWGKRADYVDEAVTRMVLSKLQATFDPAVWEEALQGFMADYQQERKRSAAQLKALEQVKQNLVVSLETLTNSELVRAAQARFEKAQEEYERLQSQLEVADQEGRQFEALKALKDQCGPVLENWPQMSREEKRVVLMAFIDQIEAYPLEGHGLNLVVRWKDKTSDEIALPRQATTGDNWLPEQTGFLLHLVEMGATQLKIARAFPDRKWTSIRMKYWRERGGSSELRLRPKPIRDQETYRDYLERTGQVNDALSDNSFTDYGFGNSSRNRTPRWASEISPGRGHCPPPTSPA